MDLLYTIATARQREMERTAVTERLAAGLRRERPRRSPAALLWRAVGRIRDTRPTLAPEPCPTC